MENNWDNLSMREKSDLISLFLQNGISDLGKMKDYYNGNHSYDIGGDMNKEDEEYLNTLENYVQSNPTGLFEDNENASKARVWLYRNAPDKFREYYLNLPKESRDRINPKFIPDDIQSEAIAQSVSDTMSRVGEKYVAPVVLSGVGGAGGLVGGMVSGAVNMGIMWASNGQKDSFGDLFFDPEKRPVLNAVADMFNPGSFIGGFGTYSTIPKLMMPELMSPKAIGKYVQKALNNNIRSTNLNAINSAGNKIWIPLSRSTAGDIDVVFNEDGRIRTFFDDSFHDLDMTHIVDDEGNVNRLKLLSTYRNVLKYLNKNNIPIVRGLKESRSSTGNRSISLKQHIEEGVNIAQRLPLPRGTSRADLVRAVLVHDIGKLIDNNTMSHAESSANLIENIPELNEFNSPGIVTAVRSHMGTPDAHQMKDITIPIKFGQIESRTNASPLTRGLWAADAMRPSGSLRDIINDDIWYNDIIRYNQDKYPYLMAYPKENNVVGLYQGTNEEKFYNVILPILRGYGYRNIRKGESIEQYMTEIMQQHNRFMRGTKDRKVELKPDEIAAITDELGEVNNNNIAINDVTHAALYPSGSGRAGLFGQTHTKDNTIKYLHTDNSKRIKASPEDDEGLYLSASPNFYKMYGHGSRPGEYSTIVEKHVKPMKAGEDVIEYFLRNDFALYNMNINAKSIMSDRSKYDIAYRLQTGRSLEQDMKEAGIKRPIESKGDFVSLDYRPTGKSPSLSDILDKFSTTFNTSVYTTKSNRVYNVQADRGKELYNNLVGLLIYRGASPAQKLTPFVNSILRGLLPTKLENIGAAVLRSGNSNKIKYFVDRYINGHEGELINKWINKHKPDFSQVSNQVRFKGYTAEQKADFMREMGTVPIFEFPDFGYNEAFATNGANWGKGVFRRNDPSGGTNPQIFLLGRKGDKVVDFNRMLSPDELAELDRRYDYIMQIPEIRKGVNNMAKSHRRDNGARYVDEYFWYDKTAASVFGNSPFIPITRKTYSKGGNLK